MVKTSEHRIRHLLQKMWNAKYSTVRPYGISVNP